ncbi:thioesterase family protein [Sphingomonas rubra]|uniref:Acyl-CoA thioesterase n=1 Tax=Sphingomonas rubra TaxID=634430 RepID=A0A1I5RRB1_9SPHN|nr:thioesterase family protein [Sphingomonas rubra]SFP61074.1 Acyl-CoA thioesterase [Sphingomonas rubra]
MTSLAEIVGGLRAEGDGWRGTVPATWQQGRTAYGGLSAALALHAAMRVEPDLPPLRSAQVSFIGPLSGAVTIRATRLRRGRNAAFIQADVTGEAGLGLRATFVFMAPIASRLSLDGGSAPPFPRPGADTQTYHGMAAVPFTQNFELVDQRDGLGAAEWLRWVRLRERDGIDPAVAFIAVADCLPPAAIKLVGGHVPLSSMTWLVNLLRPPETSDGWWLLHAAADHARDGASSQRMAIWNADGAAVAEQMQSVAIFA